MILRRLRSRASLYLAVGLLLMAVSLAARATQPMTKSEVAAFVYWTLAVVLTALVGSAAAFASYFLTRLEGSFEKSVTRLEESVARAHDAIRIHDESPGAHFAAAEHNHGPMNTILREHGVLLGSINAKVNTLVEGQKLTVEELSEQDTRLCTVEKSLTTLLAEHHILHGRALQKRQDDPPTVDIEKLRGRQ